MSDFVTKLDLTKRMDLDAGRRAFFKSTGLAAASAAVLGVAGLPSSADAQQITDADILNFALNFEYLGTEFYLRAVFGRGLDTSDVQGTGAVGPVNGKLGQPVPFETPLVAEFARELAENEQNHVRFLRRTLGSAAVSRPPIELNVSFTAAALAAGLIQPGQTFDPFASENNYLLAAFLFEDVEVTSYKGASPLLSKRFIESAAGILATEAYHAGVIRTFLSERGAFVQAGAISEARDALNGTDVDQGLQMVLNDGSGNEVAVANLVPTDADSVAFSRTPQQVLRIGYLGPAPTPTSFFPVGLNGRIR